MRRKLTPLLAGLILFSGVHVSLALTLSEIRTNIRRNVRDTASSASLRRYSDAVLNAYINEAQRIVVNDTWASSEFTSQSITSGTTYYGIPSNTIRVWRVTLNNANLPELELGQLDADNYDTAWSTATNSPTAYFIDKSSRNAVGLYPVPSSSGGTLKVYFFQLVPDLSSDSDVPFDSDLMLYSYHDLLVYHATFRILLTENRLQEANGYLNLYNQGLELMARNVGHKPLREIAPSKEIKP